MGRSDDDKKHKRRRKNEKGDKKKHHRKRHRSSSRDDVSASSSVSEHRRRGGKDRKRKSSKRGRVGDTNDTLLQRNYELADALGTLLAAHPPLASELPIMLIRLCGGTTFDLSQMPTDVARSLAAVFACLQPFGVVSNGTVWSWQAPTKSTSNATELVLINVVRSLLDQIGLSMDAIAEHERRLKDASTKEQPKALPVHMDDDEQQVAAITQALLDSFRTTELASELPDLCAMIVRGESVAVDGLADEKLRNALMALFVACGLEPVEMETDNDDDDNGAGGAHANEPSMGYSLPECDKADFARASLQHVVQQCQTQQRAAQKAPPMRRLAHGPLLHAEDYGDQRNDDADSSNDDDEGPALEGVHVSGAALPRELVQARAQARARQLQNVKAGLDANDGQYDGASREEWMLDPGKFDLFAAIKTGRESLQNRTFDSKPSRGGDQATSTAIDPKVQAEIDDIMAAQHAARGPSLLDEHREKQQTAAAATALDNNKKQWKWDREADLDAGRRVDKANLSMIFGSAAGDLQKKFSGGLG